jgi:hypothetical protein
VIDADPIVTDIWGARDHGGATAADNLIPPTNLRYAAYFRTSFTPAAPVQNLAFEGLIDDGAIIYINGVESARINLAAAKDAGDWQVFADGSGHGANAVSNEVEPQGAFDLGHALPAGVPVEIAVSVRSNSATSSDMGFDLRVYSSNPPLTPPMPAGFDVLVENLGGGQFQISWPSVAGAVYDIEFSQTLEAASWFPINTNILADPSGTNTEPDFPGLPEGFYRVIQR